MSVAHIEQFYGKATKDPALVNKMLMGTKGPDDFIRNAVKEGKNQGYEFSYEEADAWIKKQQKAKASGELSDSQLESVAGGKNALTAAGSGLSTAGGALTTAGNAAQSGIESGIGSAITWGTGAVNTVEGGLTSVGNSIASGATSAANSVAHFFSSW
jgi:predicted ribosomally synthesized peptide with nif11-like leader